MNVWRRLRTRFGWIDCPQCGEFRRPRWVKDWLVFEDEPPLFGHWYMPCCGARTETEATPMMNEAARSFGARDFDDFMDKTIPK